MSLFNAMTTSISGLNAQSTAFSNIGDNIANSQTVGYKDVGTTFSDYISVSNLSRNESGAVVARPDYNNSLQGGITQTQNPLNLAISGQGFFPVSLPNGTSNGNISFSATQQYTRAGDFKLDDSGYLVNSTGHYLNGWSANADGTIDTTKLVPLEVGRSGYSPIKTSAASISANLPATPTTNNAVTTEMPVTDAVGTAHNLELSWTPSGTANQWNLSISQEGSTTPLGSAVVTFGDASGSGTPPAGTISSVVGSGGLSGSGGYVAGHQATVGLTAEYGYGDQPITISLGQYGGTDGVTQFSGTDYNLVSLTQNGVKAGSFSSVSMEKNGDVVVNYDNGSQRTVARVPVVTFSSPDSLQREDGQSFQATQESGTPRVNQVGSNGAGTLVTSATEASNVDIATEFTKLIVAQRAYSANTKMVTTADDLLQQTIDMKR